MNMDNQSPLSFLSKTYGLSAAQVEQVAAIATQGVKGAFSDIYFQMGVSESVSIDQSVITRPSRNIVSGAGVRSVMGDKTGYSFTDNVNYRNLVKAAKKAGSIVKYGSAIQAIEAQAPTASEQRCLYAISDSLLGVPFSEKIALLRKIDEMVRAYDKRVTNVSTGITMSETVVVIASSLGELVLDRRPMLSLWVSCLVEDGTRKETGRSSTGGRVPMSFLFEEDRWQTVAKDAAQRAIDLLSAKAAPAGEMTVVLGPGWPGILVHEAIGHPLELDFNRKNQSVFANRVGEKVASSLCTLVDDGTIINRRGSLNVDDEGTPTQRNVLIENGILKGYLSDRMNASLVGGRSSGNGRRESYRFPPQPRMTNTFMLGGESTPEEIIASVKYGLYAYSFADGQVDVSSGNFTFAADGARMIRNGKLAEYVSGATLIDNAAKALLNISMVGNDWALDKGMGMCGKGGQMVPVGVGMATVRLDNLTVGGTGK